MWERILHVLSMCVYMLNCVYTCEVRGQLCGVLLFYLFMGSGDQTLMCYPLSHFSTPELRSFLGVLTIFC